MQISVSRAAKTLTNPLFCIFCNCFVFLLFVVVFVRFYALQRAKIRIFLHIRRICAKEKCKKAKTTGCDACQCLAFCGLRHVVFGLPQAGNNFLHVVFALLAGGS
ncbi:MAG: hypothetical protein II170_05185, partial [Bacteroidaceae bacterium]|nr:hypothetical protein [Bacteroidaceae bacterium]